MAYYFYTETSIIYLFSGRKGSAKTEWILIWCYRFVLLVMVVFGAVREANVVWQMGDIGVGLTAWINVLTLLVLCPHAIKALKEYESDPASSRKRRK
jgi:AGCS family alanine or glycine:cation symporter